MIQKKIIIISVTSFLIGTVFFSYQKEWIILKFPKIKNSYQPDNKNKFIKKSIQLFYWNNDKWNKENTEIIWNEIDINENIHQIVSSWLNLIEEEKIIEKKVSLQNVLGNISSNEIYLSFDRNLFTEENTTFYKLMLIESLLKTIREADIKINKIYFLVHHQEMKDSHLDFSSGWTINGFLNSKN